MAKIKKVLKRDVSYKQFCTFGSRLTFPVVRVDYCPCRLAK